MDRQQIEDCLRQVDAYRASGQKAADWAAANGMTVRQLASWSAHAALWRARLNGEESPARRRRGEAVFVAAALPTSTGATIKVELPGTAGAVVHWPVAHARELAAWLREMRG